MLTFMENKGIPKEAAVSVIIPVYNVAAWLDECLRSVVGQTFTDFEAILVDDGSTDGSSELCDEWAKKDFRIRVIHKENAGPSAARNTGILEAKGRYFCFLFATSSSNVQISSNLAWSSCTQASFTTKKLNFLNFVLN